VSGGGALAFGREKRLLLGALALVAALPLPFNQMVGWGTFGAFAAAIGWFLVRAWRGADRWLPVWGANVAAVGYLPLFLLDLQSAFAGPLVQPVLRLGLFAVAVKLFSLRRERDKWHAVLGIFFLFLASMATSVHMTVVLDLAVFVVVGLLALARFALLHLLAGFGWRGGEPRVPLAGFLAAAATAAVVVAVPIFAALPRVGTPFLSGPVGGGAGGGGGAVAGYSDRVGLDSIGRLRDNREVALRLDYRRGGPRGEVRLKGGTYERFTGVEWRRSRSARRRRDGGGSRVVLAGGTVVDEVTVHRMPLGASALPFPVEALALDRLPPGWRVDRGGAVALQGRPSLRLDYRVSLGPRPISAAEPPEPGSDAATLDLGGVTPRMAALAATVAGSGPTAEKVERLERYLIDNYEYSFDLVAPAGGEAVDHFLFAERRGHCEYFASALVLLLRAQGIHARLVTGFLGAERNTLGLWVVRQGNAHAWVEAWVPGEGWRVLDPTPPAGRPGGGTGIARAVSNLYDALVFQWDRYVLTYDGEDQGEAVRRLAQRLAGLWSRWTADDEPAAAAAAAAGAAAEAGAAGPAAVERRPGLLAAAGVLLALLLGLAGARARRRARRPDSATRAYRRLRRRLAAAGVAVGEATGPFALARTAAARFAAAAAPSERIVALYVKESFGGVGLDAGERAALAPALAEVRRALRKEER
jgi:protein-glutamine gamma-glutamyltransferase